MSPDPFRLERIQYIIHLADDALIQGHRNSEWTGFGPVLEQDIAISNIALDLVGQARNFYQYAATLINQSPWLIPRVIPNTAAEPVTEDSLAYLRDGWDFSNCLLCEQTNGDWAHTTLKQFFFSAYQFYLYQQLQQSADPMISAISEKALKEVTYHLRWSSEWVIRLGDGTLESHQRCERALDALWAFTGELFQATSYEDQALRLGIGADLAMMQTKWETKVQEVLDEATLAIPRGRWMQSGGKSGTHTEALGHLLAEMQFLQRAYPNATW
jgi:ring-1,2-phenylacetyl-CoA epoxidase subunit PaaC